MTNANNIKMTGIQDAADLTRFASFDFGRYVDVYYYPSTGLVMAFLLSRGSRFTLEETGCVYIDSYDSPRTAQQLADNIRGVLEFINS